MSDDEDRFLYGDSNDDEVSKPTVATSVPQPIPLEQVEAFATKNGIVANLEAKAASDNASNGAEDTPERDEQENTKAEGREDEGEGEEGEEEEEEDSDDDIEIIMEVPNRSLDFRQRPQPRQSASFTTPARPPQQQPTPSLTTEYTPRERGSVANPPAQPATVSSTAPPQSTSTPAPASTTSEQKPPAPTDGVDTNSLPVATAPPSHPRIDPDIPGTIDGRSVLEVDLSALADKGWRRPGSDISDWFNYGFDEVSWEAYCYRRRDLGDLANVLKANVLNFAGMPEEQLAALPPELRSMVMASASAMMAGGNGNPGAMMQGGMNMNGMMNPMMNMGPMMNPMMEMGGVDMGMGGQGMGMGMGPGMGNEAMGGQVMGGQGMGGQGMGGGMGGNMNGGGLSGGVAIGAGGPGQGTGRATPDVQMGGMGGEGFAGANPQGMGMQGEFGMQGDMGQQMYAGSETSGTPVPATTPTRGGVAGHFRGRGMPQNVGMRGVRGGGFAGRGRGIPVRPASPLPPNVPTGPRNKTKYKDVDNSAPAVDGLDYGGGGGGGNSSKDRATPPEYDDRSSSRKRRSSPGLEDGRGSKRR